MTSLCEFEGRCGVGLGCESILLTPPSILLDTESSPALMSRWMQTFFADLFLKDISCEFVFFWFFGLFRPRRALSSYFGDGPLGILVNLL